MRNTILILVLISGYVLNLQKVECAKGCIDCRSFGPKDGTDGGSWCMSCTGAKHVWKSPTDQTCEGTGITNCLKQTSEYWLNAGEQKWVNVCEECAEGYGTATDKDNGNLNTSCKKLEIADSRGGYWSSDPLAETVNYCAQGKYVNTNKCETIKASDPDWHTQVPVANCYAYDSSRCRKCMNGYYNVRTPNGEISEKKNDFWEYCVPIPTKFKGCLGGVTLSGGCVECDYTRGYYAKEVQIDGQVPYGGSSSSSEGKGSQICTNAEGATLDLPTL